MKLPGTDIECKQLGRAEAEAMLGGIFAGGGLVLSQIAALTGMELYSVQNWVRRGFVSSPVRKKYSPRQFCRLVIINMLKDSMSIGEITGLLTYINGDLSDEGDDMVCDDLIYLGFTDLISVTQSEDEDAVKEAAEKVAAEITDGEAEKRLGEVLTVMYFAYRASLLVKKNGELMHKYIK